MIEHALKYAEMGWAVFPVHSIQYGSCSCGDPKCSNPGKHPLTVHGFHDATTNPFQIKTWWTAHPNANIAVATGQKSGRLVVIDIDWKPERGISGIETWDEINEGYPDTVEAFSGSGGRHIYFQYPKDTIVKSGQNTLGSGIDIRADNGYIIAPPSNHYSGKLYEWEGVSDPNDGVMVAEIPDWLLRLCKDSPISENFMPQEMLLAKNQVNEIRSALAFINSENYDIWLRVGMALHSTRACEQTFGLWTEWSMQSEKYDPRKQRYTWSRMRADGGISIASLFGLAKQNGWTEPEEFSFTSQIQIAEREIPQTPCDGIYSPPGIMGEIVDFMMETAPRPQRAFAANGAIALCATALGRKVCGDTGLRTNLYLVSVGNTASGKDHPRKIIKQIFNDAQLNDFNGGENLASGQALLTRVQITPSVLFQLDEFGDLMQSVQGRNSGRHNQEIMTNMMKLFSSADSIYVGTEYADQHSRPRQIIEYPCACIHGTTTPKKWYDSFSSGDVISGYLNRMIVVDQSREERSERQDPKILDTPDSIIEWLQRSQNIQMQGTGNMVGVNPARPLQISKTEDAKELFVDYGRDIDSRIKSTVSTPMCDLLTRAWELSDKLATVAACSTNIDDPIVDYNCGLWAIKYVNYHLEQLMIQVNERVADSEFERNSKEFYSAILDSGSRGITKYELGRRKPFAKHKPQDRDVILNSLIGAGMISFMLISQSGAGKTRTAYVAVKTNSFTE